MTKFDFKKLREQVKNTGDVLKKTFKGSDAKIMAAEKIGQAVRTRMSNADYINNLKQKASVRKNNPVYIKNCSDAKKGKKITEEHKLKIANAFYKPIVTPNGIFSSRKKAMEKLGLSATQIYVKLKKCPDQYYYISREEYIILTGKEIE